MSRRAARGHAARLHQQQQRSLTDLPSSWCQQLLLCLSASSRLSLRSTCQHFLHICDMRVDTDSMQQQQSCMGRSTSPAQASQPQHSSMQQQQELSRQISCSHHRPCQTQLVLKLARRQPNLLHVHELGLLKQVGSVVYMLFQCASYQLLAWRLCTCCVGTAALAVATATNCVSLKLTMYSHNFLHMVTSTPIKCLRIRGCVCCAPALLPGGGAGHVSSKAWRAECGSVKRSRLGR